MLLNNTITDIRSLMRQEGQTQKTAAERLGITQGAVSQTMRIEPITPSWVRLIEALGYDIEIQYKKRP